MVFLTVTVDSYSPWGQVRESARGNLSGAVWKVITAEAEHCNEIHQEPVTPLNHVPVSLNYLTQMDKLIGTQKFCSCPFVAEFAPICSSLNPVQDATEITHRKGGWKGNGLSTFSKGCDTPIQQNLLVSLSFPAEMGVSCKVMFCVSFEGCCALWGSVCAVKLLEQLWDSLIVVLQRGTDASSWQHEQGWLHLSTADCEFPHEMPCATQGPPQAHRSPAPERVIEPPRSTRLWTSHPLWCPSTAHRVMSEMPFLISCQTKHLWAWSYWRKPGNRECEHMGS